MSTDAAARMLSEMKERNKSNVEYRMRAGVEIAGCKNITVSENASVQRGPGGAWVTAHIWVKDKKDNAEYVIYERDADGYLTRTGRVVDSEISELHMGEKSQETLVGWSEKTVFWTSAEGAAIGYALKRGQ